MPSERRWSRALAEHDAAVQGFVSECERIASNDWQREPAPGKWTPAAVALHLCNSYELGSVARTGGPHMRMKVSPSRARLLRALLLPCIIATSRFPRVRAPREVAPDIAESQRLTREAAMERLRRAAAECAASVHLGARDPSFRVTHAYFGPLPPYRILRLLSAHTRHHTRTLAQAMAAVRGGAS